MDARLFQSLVTSLKQGAAIRKGTLQPARVTKLEVKAAPKKMPIARKAGHIVSPGVKAATPARSRIKPVDAKKVREKTGLSQTQFAFVIKVSVATLRNWEQHRREPTGPAEALLKIMEKAPEVALQALNS